MSSSAPKLLSSLSLVCGAVGILLLLVFFFTFAESGVLYTGLGAGVVGIILGAVALAKRQAKGLAVTGVVLSSVTLLAVIGTVIVSLVLVGAISL